jgi:hypothetical protein
MKPFDIFILVIAVVWILFYILQILVLFGSPEVKYMGAKITIGRTVIIPWIIIAFVLWRVYG